MTTVLMTHILERPRAQKQRSAVVAIRPAATSRIVPV